MAIKLITFDLDNTLWHTDPVIVKAEQVQWIWIEKLSPNAKDYFNDQILQQLKIRVAEQNPELRHKLSQLRLEFLKQVFIICGEPEEQAQLFAQRTFEEFLHMRNQVKLFPGALELLQQLKGDYQLIALSNGNSDLSRIGLDHLFSAHFHAENVAQPKPHQDMFLAALEHAKVEANECIHVGDHPQQDIAAANTMGFKTVWANLLEQEWPNQLKTADHEINQLEQMLTVIKHY